MNLKLAIDRALSFHEKKDLAKALELYLCILKEEPNHFQTLNLVGLLYQEQGQDRLALEKFKNALMFERNYFLTYYSAATSCLKLAEHQLAVHYLNASIVLNPQEHQAYINKGTALHKLGDLQGSLLSYKRSICIKGDFAPAHFNLACLLRDMKDEKSQSKCLKAFEKSIELSPQHYPAYINLANELSAKKDYEEAILLLSRSISIEPALSDAYFNKGTVQFLGAMYELSKESLTCAVLLNPGSYGGWNNLGNACKELSQFNSANKSYKYALELANNSERLETLYNLGVVQHQLGFYEDAKQNYDQALEIDASFIKALNGRALTLRQLKHYKLAIEDFKHLISIDPNYEYALGNLIHTQMHAGDWSSWSDESDHSNGSNASKASSLNDLTKINSKRYLFENEPFKKTGFLVDQMIALIEQSKNISHPFPVLALIDSPLLHLKSSVLWVQDKHPKPIGVEECSKPLLNPRIGPLITEDLNKRIRIAYLSADFHNHATAFLIAELFELHAKDKFEVFAISFGPHTEDDMQKRIKSAVEHFIDVKDIGDKEIADLCKAKGIDIAIDLKGFTLDSKFNIFVHRCAPIQVSYLGYPGTSGSECMDYLIADKVCIPPEYEACYSEKIIYLPDSYQINDTKRLIKPCKKTKLDHGLPMHSFVFCCFNSTYKITPSVFTIWMDLLKKVGSSVLWLLEDDLQIAENLKLEALKRGVDPQRLIFANRLPLSEHLGRHIHADLFLDTLPYNAHTTASDALWAGLPVLTQIGKGFAARVCASLLSALGLAEMITQNDEDYMQLAIHLATHRDELDAIRHKLNLAKAKAPLFKSAEFTKYLEKAFEEIFKRHKLALPKESIHIQFCS
jgi:predicted O-linked N-acetylglucosamine transferase (SPINDLY family)